MAKDPDRAQRFDERDTMFARMARRPETEPYRDYYRRRAELRERDDQLRRMPALMEPGGRAYDPEISAEAGRYFRLSHERSVDAEVVEAWRSRLTVAEQPEPILERFCVEQGAVAAGVAPIDPAFVYSHKGRLDEDYGRAVELHHECAIVFLVEMDHAAMQRAPLAETVRESAFQYYRAAVISWSLQALLESLGHAAKAHYDAHYDVILPPLAVAAGLGEMGRNNILVADRFGSRVRIGAVTTNAPLKVARPVSLGVERFCEICLKCAENCPPRALSLGPAESIRGVRKWPTSVERCYGFWRTMGTDCGVCMACCPFSHRSSWPHGLVRATIRSTPLLNRLLVALDDLFYGRRWATLSELATAGSGGSRRGTCGTKDDV